MLARRDLCAARYPRVGGTILHNINKCSVDLEPTKSARDQANLVVPGTGIGGMASGPNS